MLQECIVWLAILNLLIMANVKLLSLWKVVLIVPTVNDFIECNENCRIAIYWTPTIEDVGLFNDKLYDGMLYDVPEKFRDMKVVREGYGLTFKGNVLYVIGDRFGV